MLKTGDAVQVRKDLVVDTFYGGARLHNGMRHHLGKTTTVLGPRHYNRSHYGIKVDTEGYDWTEEMLTKL